MKTLVTFAFLAFSLIDLKAQSLGSNRVNLLKSSVVRILTDGIGTGTGFIITDKGHVVTCWHVIEYALNSKKKLQIEFSSGEIVEAQYLTALLEGGMRKAVGYDYIVLAPINPRTKFSFLKLGNFSSVAEGDELITMGYPFGISQPVIAKGIMSTKWIQTASFFINNKQDSIARNVAWLDLTMNKGNSGGPIIKLGVTPEDDRVIGIATFILNPFANPAQQISNIYSNPSWDIQMGGVSTSKVNKLFADAIANNSIGVSGCISIDHILEFLNATK